MYSEGDTTDPTVPEGSELVPAADGDGSWTEPLAMGTDKPGSPASDADVIGDWHVVSTLGAGAFGAVYGAIHRVIGKRAAIKILKAVHGETASADRFVQEARAINQVDHPNVVDVFDFGLLKDGRPYMVMEHLEGEAMSTRMRRAPLDPDEIVSATRQICAALGAAHAKGIVHCDLKPGNVFFIGEGRELRVKLLDFGLVKLRDDSEHKLTETATGVFMGTPAYASPEQINGRRLGPETDVYSLGVILYELCTGERPFRGESAAATVAMHLTETPLAPRELNPAVSAELSSTIMRMLSKSPLERPTLGAVVAAIEDLTMTREEAVSVPWVEMQRTSVPRWRRHALALFVGACVLGIAVPAVVLLNKPSTDAPSPVAAPVVDSEEPAQVVVEPKPVVAPPAQPAVAQPAVVPAAPTQNEGIEAAPAKAKPKAKRRKPLTSTKRKRPRKPPSAAKARAEGRDDRINPFAEPSREVRRRSTRNKRLSPLR
jgi:serine/threonine protein kinase